MHIFYLVQRIFGISSATNQGTVVGSSEHMDFSDSCIETSEASVISHVAHHGMENPTSGYS